MNYRKRLDSIYVLAAAAANGVEALELSDRKLGRTSDGAAALDEAASLVENAAPHLRSRLATAPSIAAKELAPGLAISARGWLVQRGGRWEFVDGRAVVAAGHAADCALSSLAEALYGAITDTDQALAKHAERFLRKAT